MQDGRRDDRRYYGKTSDGDKLESYRGNRRGPGKKVIQGDRRGLNMKMDGDSRRGPAELKKRME